MNLALRCCPGMLISATSSIPTACQARYMGWVADAGGIRLDEVPPGLGLSQAGQRWLRTTSIFHDGCPASEMIFDRFLAVGWPPPLWKWATSASHCWYSDIPLLKHHHASFVVVQVCQAVEVVCYCREVVKEVYDVMVYEVVDVQVIVAMKKLKVDVEVVHDVVVKQVLPDLLKQWTMEDGAPRT